MDATPVSARPGRVLQVCTRMNVGGPARHILTLGSALPPGWRTVLATGTAPDDEGELLHPGMPVVRLPLVRSPDPIRDGRALLQFRSLLTRLRPDVVNSHMAKAGAVARLAARTLPPWRRPAQVHTFHGHVLEGYFGSRVEAGFIAAERMLAAGADALVAVSDEVRDALLDLGIGTEAQWRVIPVALELEPFLRSDPTVRDGRLRAQLGLDAGTPLVGALGRLAPIKDHALLVEAIGRCEDVHLVILGDGEERERLTALAARLAPGRVHLPGWGEAATALADIDLVAVSSRNEGTPLSLIEASAAGVAVVSTDVGGVRSVVDDGLTGLLVPRGDADALAVAIRRLIGDPAERKAMGRRGRAHVADRYAAAAVGPTQALYAELAERARSGRTRSN